jgi:hypothetical protein
MRAVSVFVLWLGAIGVAASCYGPLSRQKCSRQDECPAGSFCSGGGFCRQECVTDQDCPCGAFCGSTCGLCLSATSGSPATCYARSRGLSLAEVAGICRGSLELLEPDSAVASPQNCPPSMLECPGFTPMPSEDAVRDAGAEMAPEQPDAGDGSDASQGDV